MKPGDLVEFKAGLFGLKPPQNVGIYLDRVRRKGSFFVVLHTLRGRQEVKAENVTSRKLEARVDPEASEGELTQRLKQLIEQVGQGKVREEKAPEGELSDRDAWQRVKDVEGEPLPPEEIAGRVFGTKTPARGQVTQVRKALDACRETGVGYFEREPGREERWRPLTRAQHSSFHMEKDRLNRLRNKLVLVEEVEDEQTGYLRTVYRGIALGEAGLDDEDRARLAFVGEAMMDFVLHDRFRGAHTLGTSGKHTLDGFSLFPYLKFLAHDWTGAERVSVSSAFIEFCVGTGILALDAAVALVARRNVLREPDFGWEIPPDVLRAAEKPPVQIPEAWLAGRRDLRAQRCFTIDPPDARDHDDAVGVEIHEDGSADLWVHIADVAHYVEKDGTLDHEARRRATSVYLPTGVLPMLPPRLSNDLCSLEPQKDRLAMTVRIRYDAEGRVLEEEAMESVIRVTANVPYPQVERAIEEGDAAIGSSHDASIGDGWEFRRMRAFADRLDRHRRGLAIETSETRVHLSADNVEHVEKMGTPATRLIETFMVAANEAVARILTRAGVPLLYRCHPLPDRAAVARFNAQCETMQVPVRIDLPEPVEARAAEAEEGESLLDQLKKGRMQMFGGGSFSIKGLEPEEAEAETETPPPPVLKGLAQLPPEEQEAWLAPFRKALAQVAQIEDEALRGLVYLKTLGCMGRAFYTPANLGHFGLGSTCYAHFTSPIRRYPDVVVHRQLKWLLRGREGPPPYAPEALDPLADHTSHQGAAAERLERGTVDAALVFASRGDRWSGPQRALVIGITRGGVFLSLEGGLEARVSTSDIPGGPWSVDEHESRLVSGRAERPEAEQDVTAANWRDLVDPETGEVERVRLRLGDRAVVHIAARDYVDGKVAAKLLQG